jgi:hypothetical protein
MLFKTHDNNNTRKQISAIAETVKSWPAWKRNILTHSAQPMNSLARPPIKTDI